MESPERNPHTSDCEPQGSPTFSFLCTLSPIKPVKSARLAQTYSEINFPSAVSYNAPKVEQEDTASLTRDHCRNTPRASQVTKLKQITFSGGLKSPKRDNEIHEHEEKTSKTPVKLSSISNKDNQECNELNNSENLVTIDTVTEDMVNPTACCISEIGTGIMGKDIVLEHSRALCNTICLSSANNGDCKKLLDFSREVSELEFMMFGECDKHSQQMCVTENEAQVLSPTLLGLSIEEVEEYIASLKEVVKEEQEKKETGCSSESISNSDGGNIKFGDALVDEDNQNPSTAVRVSGPLQRGVRRRCLDFDVKTESDMVSLSNTSQDTMLSYAEKPDTSVLVLKERTATRVVGSSVVVPCGIGLHLNSLTRSITFPQARQNNGRGCSLSPLTKRENVMQELGLSEFNRNNASNEGSGEEFHKASRIDFVEEAKIGNFERELQCSDQIVDSSKSITCSRNGVKQLQDDQSSGLGKRPCPLGRKRVSLPGLLKDVEASEDLSSQTPPSPLRKKRKTSTTSEKSGDGCKRCTCKKSKCLKLYCECFAAGVYCGDSCSCQGCFNKPEYEKTVVEAREVIESRNPLAFAPKIVRATTEASPIINKKEGGHGTPAHFGRHKRGCNCKRSHCLKKYCECYQAGVACTDACRCECCENTFGKKSGAESIAEKEIQLDVLLDETAANHIDASDLCDQNYGPSRHQINSISPLTPSSNYTGQNRSTVHSRSASKRCIASSEEQILSPLSSLSSAIISRSPSRILRSCSKGGQRSSPCVNPTVTTPQGKSPISTPRILRIGNRWDDICTVTPLPKAPSRPTTGASISVIDGIESSSINRRSQHYISDCKTPAETHELNVPTTPVFSSPASRVDMNSSFRSESGLDHQLLDWIEDDLDGENNSCTPEFLRDAEVGVPPVCLLNSSSPKHKRVSPPHFQDIKDQQTHAVMNHRRRSSNNCIRSGRKFILQSIPTLLSVTPDPAECRNDGEP